MTREKLEKTILRHARYNLKLYKENRDLILLYDEYVKKITELFDFLMIRGDNLFYTIIFDILVEIGYFSADRVFDADKDTFKELSVKPGLSVICGSGVCRNVACFYEDIFKNFYKYPLKLCCLDQNGALNDDTKTFGNHIINLTLYRNAIYGFDIMNHCLFKATSNNTLTGFDFDYLLEYMPNGDLLLDLTTCLNGKIDFDNEVRMKQALLELSAMRDVLTNDEYQKLVFEANEFIIARKRLLQGFMVKNEELAHEIKKKMLSLE